MRLDPGLVRTAVASAPRPVVLIDGGSGSGKSSLAAALVDAWPGPVRLVSLDEIYPGWTGLAAGSAAVARELLRPWRPGYRRWDWTAGARADWVPLDPAAPLIVEGCGALTPENRALASYGIWCELGEAERRRRALAREPGFAAHWESWAVQEHAHWRAHRPRELADVVVRPR